MTQNENAPNREQQLSLTVGGVFVCPCLCYSDSAKE